MDKVKKAIAKLPKELRQAFDDLSIRLLGRDFKGLDVVKLKGSKNVYRLKRGKLRIIFSMDTNNLEILEVGLRNEKTYRDF